MARRGRYDLEFQLLGPWQSFSLPNHSGIVARHQPAQELVLDGLPPLGVECRNAVLPPALNTAAASQLIAFKFGFVL